MNFSVFVHIVDVFFAGTGKVGHDNERRQNVIATDVEDLSDGVSEESFNV